MKSQRDASLATLKTRLDTDYVMTAVPKLTAEWNMNRYYATTVDNNPSEDTDGYDIDIFPIESIVEPIRPNKGANKAITNLSIASDNYVDESTPRFYMSNEDDQYKYWLSPQRSDANGALVNCQPQVVYEAPVRVNKIIIKIEDTWARPTEFTVEVSTDGTNWGVVATNPVISNDGQVTLYRNSAGWSSTFSTLAVTQDIRGVRMTVTRLGGGVRKNGQPTFYRTLNADGVTYTETNTNGSNSYFSLIEISARREMDLTDRLIEVNDSFTAGEASMITPVGTISSNVANLTLWNADNLFSSDNDASEFQRLVEPNVEMNLKYVYTVGATKYEVQQFKMYVERWAGQANANIVVDLTDFSKFLKESTPPPLMYEDVTLPEIMYRLCDSIGFSNYKIVNNTNVVDYEIPVWYCNGENTVWEVLDELAAATQSLIYFDAYGTLLVKTREAAFDATRTPDLDLRAVKRNTLLPNVISLELNEVYEANVVKVIYKKTKWSKWNNGQPSMSVVWEPEGVIALRANNLLNTIPATGLTNIKISPKDLRIWPYTGMVNIEGEIFKYDGKEFVYYTGADGTTKNTVTVKSVDEHRKHHAKTPSQYRYKNHFNGNLVMSERGVWNSKEHEHSVLPKSYDIRRFVKGVRVVSSRGYRHNPRDSTITLSSEGRLKTVKDRLYMTTGSSGQVGDYKQYGFRMRFDKGEGYTDQIAGLVIHNTGANEHGYHIEFRPSSKITAKNLKTTKELIIYSRNGATITKNKKVGRGEHVSVREDDRDEKKKKKKNKDTKPKVDRDGVESTRLAIGQKIEYDVDVTFTRDEDGNHVIRVYVNGVKRLQETMRGDDKIESNTKFGLYIRGRTKATFEYLYAVRSHATLREPADDTSYLDKIKGSYYGTYADRELPYNWVTKTRMPKKNSTKRKNSKPDFFFDEFGAILHEVREYDVTFSEAPVLHSRLYNTNDWSSVVTEYRASAFGAHFIVANTTRQNAIVNGDETFNQGGGNQTVSHRMNVIGRPLVEAEENSEVEVKNEAQIRARGEIETQVESPWIQTESAAEQLSKWISEHWSKGCDEYTVDIFGNPLLEIGDMVTIDFPEKDMTPAEARFFVTSITTAYAFGITTTLTLRRAP